MRARLKIIRNARIKNLGKYQSCMAYTLLFIFKRTRRLRTLDKGVRRVGALPVHSRGEQPAICAIQTPFRRCHFRLLGLLTLLGLFALTRLFRWGCFASRSSALPGFDVAAHGLVECRPGPPRRD